jgi:hypothetical protein
MQNQNTRFMHLQKFWVRRAQIEGIPLRWNGHEIKYQFGLKKTFCWIKVMSLAGAIQKHWRRLVRATQPVHQ